MAIYFPLAAAIAAALGYPPTPIMAVGGLVITSAAYLVARRRALLRMGIVFAIFVAGHYYAVLSLGAALYAGESFEFKALRFVASDELLSGLSAIVMLISAMIGVYGPDQKEEFKKFRHEQQDNPPGQ